MRRAILLSLSLILGGCVPTADFVDLRDEVRRLEAENRKFKDIEAELRKRLEEADRLQKAGDIAKQLDMLEAKIESLRIRQQASTRSWASCSGAWMSPLARRRRSLPRLRPRLRRRAPSPTILPSPGRAGSTPPPPRSRPRPLTIRRTTIT